MSKVKGKDTKIELKLRRALWNAGHRGYRANPKLLGKPDIVFGRKKVAVFCDGDFWHGYGFQKWKRKLQPFWHQKIKSNMQRDRRVNKLLAEEGWTVIRFWEHNLDKEIGLCVERLAEVLANANKRR